MTERRIAEPILHVDMDAFFVEVERRDGLAPRGRPVVVGADARRGVVASASYEARSFEVRSAMPMVRARRLCPGLVVVPPRHRRYGEVSDQVFSIFRDFTPLVEGLSLDEAFLDVRGRRRHYADSRTVAEEIRARIRDELRLPASVGAATCLYLAKMASGKAKPDGVFIVVERTERAFLDDLDVRELWGVGRATSTRLGSMGITTIGDLARIPASLLERHLGPGLGQHLHRLANGIDERKVKPSHDARSISAEQTNGTDISGTEVLQARLLQLADRVSWRLRRAGLRGRTVSLKLRYSDFDTVTRSETLGTATDLLRDVYQSSCRLLDRVGVGDRPVRLLGISVTGLQPDSAPQQLLVDRDERWEDLAEAVDQVRLRFGRRTVVPARIGSDGSSTALEAPGQPTRVRGHRGRVP